MDDNVPAYIDLPSEAEIMQRLVKVEITPALQAILYPFIAKHGGQTMDMVQIAEMFLMAIRNFAEQTNLGTAGLAMVNVPKYIEAIVEDEDLADGVKFVWKTITTKE